MSRYYEYFGVKQLKMLKVSHFLTKLTFELFSGIGDANNSTLIKGIKDAQRVDFYHRHLLAVQEAIKRVYLPCNDSIFSLKAYLDFN